MCCSGKLSEQEVEQEVERALSQGKHTHLSSWAENLGWLWLLRNHKECVISRVYSTVKKDHISLIIFVWSFSCAQGPLSMIVLAVHCLLWGPRHFSWNKPDHCQTQAITSRLLHFSNTIICIALRLAIHVAHDGPVISQCHFAVTSRRRIRSILDLKLTGKTWFMSIYQFHTI